MKPSHWFAWVVSLVVLALAAAAVLVWWVDPYFHYRAPRPGLAYVLDNQRHQNDGIVRHFEYGALVTGSSMAENFRASDVERLWGLKTVKVPFSGASYRELRQIVLRAVAANPQLELIVVGLDFNKLIMDPDWMRNDLGVFPEYLYDDDPWNDVRYLLNRTALVKAVCALAHLGGPTSFDDYSCWHTPETRYGARAVLGNGTYAPVDGVPQRPYSEADRTRVAANVRENLEPIMSCGRKVLFFVTPYSAARTYAWKRGGQFERQLQAERQLAEAVFAHPNVRLFSFNARTEVTGNLDNYRDIDHYGPWVSEQILTWMHDGVGELTAGNLDAAIDAERSASARFDFKGLFDIMSRQNESD